MSKEIGIGNLPGMELYLLAGNDFREIPGPDNGTVTVFDLAGLQVNTVRNNFGSYQFYCSEQLRLGVGAGLVRFAHVSTLPVKPTEFEVSLKNSEAIRKVFNSPRTFSTDFRPSTKTGLSGYVFLEYVANGYPPIFVRLPNQ
jgi:hypothetical protein